MQKLCALTGKPFAITDDDLTFYETISPVIGGKKYLIPAPTLCPEERRRRRLAFRNERYLYHRTCDKCQRKLISVYSFDKPFTVYCKDCWWSDFSDPMSFGRAVDFSKPFFDQFAELMKDVPRISIVNFEDENSDFTNYGFQNKDCYLMFTSDRNEKCYYGSYVWNGQQCVDNLSLSESQYCYQCIDGDKLYECQYCQGCINCHNCFGCIEGKNLRNCFGCVGLQNKEYCFFNEQLTKEDYEKRVNAEYKDREKMLQKIREFSQKFPRRSTFQVNCEHCTGNHLKNCKNLTMAFEGYGAEDSKYMSNFPGEVHHCYDFDGAASIEWSAEVISSGLATSQIFACDHLWKGANEVYYSSYCSVNKHLFGCINLRRKEYCILNKQYSKTEYEALMPKIIEHMSQTKEWGEFFPIRISPFGYNETAAFAEYPVTKEQALKNGWKWKDEEAVKLNVAKTIPAEKLPTDISKIPDDVLNWAIVCEVTKKPFKLIPQELEFYRRYRIPIPHLHPDERHRQRMLLRNPRKLWKRECSKCEQKTMTSYPPESPVKILCDPCYLNAKY